MNLVYRTRGAWRIGVIGMMALVGYACTDEKTVQQDVFVPGVANAIPNNNPALGYDLNGAPDFPTSEFPDELVITSLGGIEGSWTFPTAYKVGTGLINPFMRVQKNGTEQGFNSDANNVLDTKSGTRSLPLNYVPVLETDKVAGGYARQFILDANENNSGTSWQISIDQFDVYVCTGEANLYDARSDFLDGSGEPLSQCRRVYDLNSGPNAFGHKTGFASDAGTKGSGNSLDYDILIDNSAFDGALDALEVPEGQCAYNGVDADPCGAWVILDVVMGAYGNGWDTDATFEEFSTIIQPWVEVTKTATATFERTYLWTIEKTAAPGTHTLFAGQTGTSNYSVTVTPDGSSDADWNVSGGVAIVNPSDLPVTISSVIDELSDGTSIALDCGVTFPSELAAGATLNCSYDYDFPGDPGDGTFTNNVVVTVDGLSVATGQSDPFAFTSPTSEVNKVINVTDYFDNSVLTALGSADWDNGATSWNYTHEFTCDGDEGDHPNVATIEETGDTDDASVTLTCLDLDVSKTAETDLERTYLWTIDKSVSPASWDLFEGDDATSDYTVTVTPNGVSDAKWNVSGVITITNNNAVSVFIDAVSDEIAGLGSVTLDCGTATFPDYELAAGTSLECSYSQDMPNGDGGNNAASVTATATDDGPTKQFGDDVDFSFAEATLTNVNKTVDITDTWVGGYIAEGLDHDNGVEIINYDRLFTCADEGPNGNTAEIEQTGQSDDANVDVTCYTLEVTKDADTDFTRTYLWNIEKSAEPGTHTLFAGQEGDTEYNVVVTPNGYQDSQWAADGTITVSNPAPMDAMLLALTDEVDGVPATVDCPSMTVPAGGTLQCTYSTALPSGSDGTNVATATQQNYSYKSDLSKTNADTTEYEGDADVLFGDPTTEIDKTVNVTDLFDGLLEDLGEAGWAGPATTFTYSRTFTCGEDYGSEQYDNTATITETGQSDDASVTLNCLNVEVSKDFATYKTRTYNWEIDKTATPDAWQLFDGDQGTTKYDVTVGLDDGNPYDDSGWMVDGEITVHNPNALSVWIASVSDLMSPDIAAVVTCEGITFPYELTAGSDLVCGYLADSPDDSDRTNTATVSAKPTASGTAKDFTGSAEVSFAEVEVTEVNKTVQVVDSWPEADFFLMSVDAADQPKTHSYDRVFACGNVTGADDVGAGTYDNTASIVDPAMSDDASVTVECYDLDVSKDASTEWTRMWTWDITKDVDATEFLEGTYDAVNGVATVGEGQSLTVHYDINLSGNSQDYGYAVAGTITVSNAGNPIDATINSVSDLIEGGIGAGVDCGVTFPYTLTAGSSLQCTYSSNLDDASSLLNTATATQQNYAYGSDLSATMSGTSDYSGTADIQFSAIPTTEIDECVDLSDILEKGGVEVATALLGDGDWCATDGTSNLFEVSFDFGPNDIVLECDDNLFDNTASFVTNDTQATGSDVASINIFQDCVEGCTLTQGYWKTHSMYHNNGKQYDDRWLNVGDLGENEIFFENGQGLTWIQVFWTAPKGNAYFNLAHQYMAAKLNILANADAPQEVEVAISQAEAWLSNPNHTIAYADALKGQEAKKLRDWASIFASFNEGLIGPGHCTEAQMDDIRNS